MASYYDYDGLPCSLFRWSALWEDGLIKRSESHGFVISTAYTGMDESSNGKRPKIFETRMLTKPENAKKGIIHEWSQCYCTKEEALKAHERACERAKELFFSSIEM